MKNIHLLPTDKPSRLYTNNGTLHLDKYSSASNGITINQNIYITSDEEIKGYGEVVFDIKNNKVVKWEHPIATTTPYFKKIILTTDQDLINDGVQSIPDEFLQWYIKNPSCEEVEVIIEYKDGYGNWFKYDKEFWDKRDNKPKFGTRYKIIIPKEEPCTCKNHDPYCCHIHGSCPTCVKKEEPKETLEEAAKKVYPNDGFKDEIWADMGEVFREKFIEGAKWQQAQNKKLYSDEEVLELLRKAHFVEQNIDEWFEQFKKK